MTNCKNCGAPIDISADRCPYCGTWYFDASVKTLEQLRREAMDMVEKERMYEINSDILRAMKRYYECGVLTPNELREGYGLERI